MTSLAVVTPAQLSALAGCAAVFLPSDPPRAGRVAFWRPDGKSVGEVVGADGARGGAGEATERLEVALPDEDGGVSLCEVPALVLTVAEAVPVLTRARAARGTHPAAAFWGAAAVLALQLAARGRLLPGVSPAGYDAWRMGPLDPADVERLRDLAAAMPPVRACRPAPGFRPVGAAGARGAGTGLPRRGGGRAAALPRCGAGHRDAGVCGARAAAHPRAACLGHGGGRGA